MAAGPLAPLRRRRDVLGARRRSSRRRRASSRATRPSRRRRSSAGRSTRSRPTGPRRSWVERHLRPLVGLAERGVRRARQEAFAAWRRFLEALAEERPLVLVFEDLHWADDALLDFVDQLVERASGVPLLVLGTARPELLERRPGLGRRQAERAHDLAVAALGRGDRAASSGALLERAAARRDDAGGAARAGRREPALRRAVRARPARARATCERAARDGAGDHRRAARRALGARRSAPPGRRRRSARSFWLGAVEAIGGVERAGKPRSCLHALERKEFVQRVAALLGRGRERVRVPPRARSATSPTGRSRGRRARRSTGAPPRGSSRSAAPTTRPRCSPTTTCRRSSWPRPRGSTRQRCPTRPGTRCATPATGPPRSMPSRRPSASTTRRCALWPADDPERAQLLFRRAAPFRFLGATDAERMVEARDALLDAGDDATAAEAEMLLVRIAVVGGPPGARRRARRPGCRPRRRRAGEQVERLGDDAPGVRGDSSPATTRTGSSSQRRRWHWRPSSAGSRESARRAS